MTGSYHRIFEVSMPGYDSAVYNTFCRRKSRAISLVVGKYVRTKYITHQKSFNFTVNMKGSAKREDL